MDRPETETCGDPDCPICYPLWTKTGRRMTEAELEALAAEAWTRE